MLANTRPPRLGPGPRSALANQPPLRRLQVTEPIMRFCIEKLLSSAQNEEETKEHRDESLEQLCKLLETAGGGCPGRHALSNLPRLLQWA